jgi:hypothetical protein
VGIFIWDVFAGPNGGEPDAVGGGIVITIFNVRRLAACDAFTAAVKSISLRIGTKLGAPPFGSSSI